MLRRLVCKFHLKREEKKAFSGIRFINDRVKKARLSYHHQFDVERQKVQEKFEISVALQNTDRKMSFRKNPFEIQHSA
jgi:hypothetical protein